MAKKPSFPQIVYMYEDDSTEGMLLVGLAPSDCVSHSERQTVGVYKLDHLAVAVNTTLLEPVKPSAEKRRSAKA